MAGMTEDMFDRQRRSRSPADYPVDMRAYASTSEIARRRQSAALQQLLPVLGATNAEVAGRINGVLGSDLLTSITVRNLRSGNTIMSPRVASAIAGIADVSIRDVLPHVEAYPWLRGRFQAEFAGRSWVSIASRFDDVPIALFEGPRADSVVHPPEEPSQVARIMEDIRARIADPSSRPHHQAAADGADRPDDEADGGPGTSLEHDGVTVPPVASRRPPPAIGGAVMMSLSDTGSGLRFFYRGLMHPRRVALLESVLRGNAWPLGPADVIAVQRVDGRMAKMVRCDVVVDRDLGPRLLSVLGEPVARGGLLHRLFGRR